MRAISSFSPIAGDDARILILGSMPGAASLRAGQYYAHPRNAFWPIMGALFGAAPELPYAERAQRLVSAGVAVWDVLASCRRQGSLDSEIELDSATVNDFSGFLQAHPGIERVGCNGATATALFRRRALSALPTSMAARLSCHGLPSTSPANASWSFERKLQAWRQALCPGPDAT